MRIGSWRIGSEHRHLDLGRPNGPSSTSTASCSTRGCRVAAWCAPSVDTWPSRRPSKCRTPSALTPTTGAARSVGQTRAVPWDVDRYARDPPVLTAMRSRSRDVLREVGVARQAVAAVSASRSRRAPRMLGCWVPRPARPSARFAHVCRGGRPFGEPAPDLTSPRSRRRCRPQRALAVEDSAARCRGRERPACRASSSRIAHEVARHLACRRVSPSTRSRYCALLEAVTPSTGLAP